MQVKAKENYKYWQIESPTNLSYHYTPGSAINIAVAGVFTSNAILTFGQFSFQRFRSLSSQPDFGTASLWEVTELKEEQEEKEKESEDQEFIYQNLILENPKFETPNVQTLKHLNLENLEIETPNFQMQYNQNNQNPNINNQQHLSPVIGINPSPAPPNAEQQQQSQLLPQQNQQQPQQQPMAYAPITKIKKFTGEENNTQVWLNDVEKAIAEFKTAFLGYFSNNNSINCLTNTFTTIKQGETEAILNQFICGLCSSILQHVHLLYPGTFQDTVTCTRDFESVESEANHAQAINLVMNKSSELDSKLKQFKNTSPNTWEPKQKQSFTNIPSATVTEDKSLAAIFLFKIEEPTETPLFSEAALEKKPIMVMYMDAKIDSQSIKLILDSGSVGSIITRQLMNQLDR
ncbi:hypothetical protein G9A89_012953 [Geosiphon pyriformis]|nr:hypothetical protein G9A89_012953 [Geosiphon pyriformis]